MLSCGTMPAAVTARALSVCLLSSHAMVLGDFERQLSVPGFRPVTRRLDSTLPVDLGRLTVPRAGVYVVDDLGHQGATESLLARIMECFPKARLLVVAESLEETHAFALLRIGVKGLLTYAEAREQLLRALPQVAEGGFWVPRTMLSRFVDSVLTDTRGRRPKVGAPTSVSRREQEVLDALLENLSNKEIGSKLNISERTAKFHVSNLLAKFGVRRRADLILLCVQRGPNNF